MAKKFTVRAWTGEPQDAVSVETFATVDDADKYAAEVRDAGKCKLITVVSEALGIVIGDYSRRDK